MKDIFKAYQISKSSLKPINKKPSNKKLDLFKAFFRKFIKLLDD